MLPQIKVYDIDYDFIIKNYTDKSLWDKEWTLFLFKNYKFTLYLESIKTKEKEIVFELKLTSDLDIWNNSVAINVNYNMNNMSIDFLKNLIYTKMIRLVEWLEERYIEYKDPIYLATENARDSEREKLREIASDFLDSEGVTNDEIREVYIDNYIDKNEEIWYKLNRIKEDLKYSYLTSLYLILGSINEDTELKQKVRNSQAKNVSELEKEVKEFMDKLETEEYVEDMKENLEAV